MRTAAFFGLLISVAVAGCGSGRRDDPRDGRAISVAKTVTERSAQFPSALFPSRVGTRPCEVHAGAPGNVFRGTCSTAVVLHRDGSATVTFTQSINGDHVWVFRVGPHGHADLIKNAGAPLVELIP